MRLYLLPVHEGRPLVIVAGTTLAGLAQTMRRLGLLLLVGDPAAVALASLVAWVMTGAALRPVERMRREAAAYSVSEPMLRLPLPESNDEVARLGETLNSLLDRLQAALDRERRLLDDASHELRTPLSTLKAEIDLALSCARSPGELKAALRSAAEETNRLSRLAQDLLVLSRARDGGLQIHRVRTDLGDMLERISARHRPRADQAGCRIECHAQPVTIAADPMRLTQALDNLMDNAIRYAESGGTIRVTADVRDDAVTITIENPGPGFPVAILETAFEPFVSGSHYRAIAPGEDGTLAGQPGAGLGLAIVKAVVQAHHGTVTAANVPGGARVTMSLLPSPLGAASPAAFMLASFSLARPCACLRQPARPQAAASAGGSAPWRPPPWPRSSPDAAQPAQAARPPRVRSPSRAPSPLSPAHLARWPAHPRRRLSRPRATRQVTSRIRRCTSRSPRPQAM